MKIEPRGKYAGVKVHLDGEESQAVMDWYRRGNSDDFPIWFVAKLALRIRRLQLEVPDLLKDRTEDQVAAALQQDKDKIEAQQAAMKKGKDWKGV